MGEPCKEVAHGDFYAVGFTFGLAEDERRGTAGCRMAIVRLKGELTSFSP